MTFRTGTGHDTSIPGSSRLNGAFFSKISLLYTLFLLLLLVSPGAKAESPAIGLLNPGLNDVWYAPEKSGQGFFITVYPKLATVSLAWFTYETELPSDGTEAKLGDSGHRWLTAVGPFVGNKATLTVFVSRGGLFNSTEPPTTTDLDGDVTITIEFTDCTS